MRLFSDWCSNFLSNGLWVTANMIHEALVVCHLVLTWQKKKKLFLFSQIVVINHDSPWWQYYIGISESLVTKLHKWLRNNSTEMIFVWIIVASFQSRFLYLSLLVKDCFVISYKEVVYLYVCIYKYIFVNIYVYLFVLYLLKWFCIYVRIFIHIQYNICTI